MPKKNVHFPLVLVKELGVREELAILLRNLVIDFSPPDLLRDPVIKKSEILKVL